MTIFYAVVARGKTVLVEHTGRSGNFPTVARMILAEIPAHDDKRSLSHERYACQVSAIASFAVGHLRMHVFCDRACAPSCAAHAILLFMYLNFHFFCGNCAIALHLLVLSLTMCLTVRSSRRNYFHYVVADGITYLCLADEVDKQRVPFAFLQDIQQRFSERYGDRARTAIAFAMNQEFQPELQHRIVRIMVIFDLMLMIMSSHAVALRAGLL
jgi:hypothetical protein